MLIKQKNVKTKIPRVREMTYDVLLNDRNSNMRCQFETPIQMTKSPKLRNFRGGQLDGHAKVLTDMLVFQKWMA